MRFNRFWLITPLFLLPIFREFKPWIHASASHYYGFWASWLVFAIVVGVWPQLAGIMPRPARISIQPGAPNRIGVSSK